MLRYEKYARDATLIELNQNGAAGDLLVDLLKRVGHGVARAHDGNAADL